MGKLLQGVDAAGRPGDRHDRRRKHHEQALTHKGESLLSGRLHERGARGAGSMCNDRRPTIIPGARIPGGPSDRARPAGVLLRSSR
ncbi:hypothetical protein GCM10027259_22520 [Micromonospora palomenae]